MEANSTGPRQLRAILPLLKARIVERDPLGFKIHLGGTTTITVSCKVDMYDIRDGDLLHLYTEVLLAPAKGIG